MAKQRATVQPSVERLEAAAKQHPALAEVSRNYLVECALAVLESLAPEELPELPEKPLPAHIAGGRARGEQLLGKPAINPPSNRKKRK